MLRLPPPLPERLVPAPRNHPAAERAVLRVGEEKDGRKMSEEGDRDL